MGRYEQQHVSLFIIQTKNTYSGNYAGSSYFPSRTRVCVCIIRPVCRNIFHIQERSIAERHLPWGFYKDESRVGPKNVSINLLNFTGPNFLSNNAINNAVQKAYMNRNPDHIVCRCLRKPYFVACKPHRRSFSI